MNVDVDLSDVREFGENGEGMRIFLLLQLEARLVAQSTSRAEPVHGTMTQPQQQKKPQTTSLEYDKQFDTLDEPIWHTVVGWRYAQILEATSECL